LLGLLTSIAGASVTFLVRYRASGEEMIPGFLKSMSPPVIAVFIASIGLILSFVVGIRLEESQEELSRNSTLDASILFERAVAKELQKLGVLREAPDPASPYDFAAEV